MLQAYRVKENKLTGMVLQIPRLLAKSLNLKANQLIELQFGSLTAQVKITISKSSEGKKSIGMTKMVLDSLMIPNNLFLNIKRTDPGQFHAGPVIGILTFPHVIYLNQLKRYKNHAEIMENMGLLYVFTPSDIRPETKTIMGFYYNKQKKDWIQREFPYPDAVIDRMYPNNYETHSQLEKVIGQNKIFNKKTLITKMEFNETLSKDPVLKKVIPETKLFQSPNDLNYFLSKYGGVFLKPVDSMRGRGIIYVNVEGNELTCQYMKDKEPAVMVIPQAESIYEVFEQVSEPNRPYIIQRAVERISMDRPFGFRVMTTKNETGKWIVPIVIAKAAPPGGFLTNVSSGADYIPLSILFKQLKEELHDGKPDNLDILIDLSLKTAIALDNEFGPLGKLGIDAVMDKSGKLWLIEANGNPGIIYRKGQREFPAWHTQAYKHPIAYSFYLAGFAEYFKYDF